MAHEFIVKNGLIVDNGGAQITGSTTSTLGFTGSLQGTASYASNADLLDGKDSTIFATTSSNTFIGNQTITGSLLVSGSTTQIGNNTLTGNTILSGSIAISGSQTFTGIATQIGNSYFTGSINISGSTTQVGDNSLLGNTTLSGSIIISGSHELNNPSIKLYGDTETNGAIKFLPVIDTIDNSISGSYIYVSGSTQDLYFTQNGSGYANTTRLRWLEGNLYTGLLNGGLITATTGSTTFNVSSGSGIIVNLGASLTNNPYPTIKYVNWGNLTNNPITYLTSSIQTFVGIDENGAITQQTTAFNDGQYNTIITIGTVLHQNKSTVNASITYPNVAYGYKQRSYDFLKAFGPLKLSGLTINTSSSLGLTVGSGTAFAEGRNYQIDPNNPSYIIDSGTSVSKIFRYYQSGSEFVQDTNNGAGYTVIDPANYNPGGSGSLAAVPGSGVNKQWSIQRIFWYPNSATKGIVVYYGSTTYASEVDAASNLPYESFLEVENTRQNAVYLGALILRNDAVFTDSTTYKILPGGLFRNVGGSGGGGTAVSTLLSSLGDVAISGPTDHQPLTYDITAGKWVNASTLSASLSGNATTATTASYAITASYLLGQSPTSSYALTASYVSNAISSSYAITASYVLGQSATSSYALTASYVQNAISASYIVGGATVSSASYASYALSSSYAATASSADNFTVRGTLTAQTIVSQTITSSISFITGSTKNGSLLSNSHQFTGSILATGSLTVSGSTNIAGGTGTTLLSSNADTLIFTGSLYTTGSVTLSGITAGTTETNILVTDASGNVKTRSNLSLQGTTGTQGTSGAQGSTGAQGATGAQGTIGTTGAQGAVGSQGTSGAQGSTGSQGTIGSTGAQGAVGSQGAIGATGAQGTVGDTGAQGVVGSQGTTGDTGAQGTIGTTGAQGSVGSQGTSGTQGSIGAQGTVGDTGVQGAVGSQGTTGTLGATGAQGAVGSQGSAGAQGTVGSQGTIGTTGAQGAAGSNGAQGAAGSNGSQGSAGSNGAQGAAGTNGAQGTAGSNGAQGTAGSNGAQGAAGSNGAQGAVGSQGSAGSAGAQGTAGSAGAQGTAGLLPSNSVSYGGYSASAIKGGYYGILMGTTTSHLNYMADGSGNGGIYRESSGHWAIFWNASNACIGFGGSSTASGYAAYTNGNHFINGYTYSNGPLYGTIFYDINNGSYYCDPAGTSVLNAVSCASLTETSSKRYKENIYTLDNALDKVIHLRGVSYNRKGSKIQEVGVIAEEVAEIIPEVVNFDIEQNPDSVSYGRITALLIEAVKELKAEIEILKQK